jgi:transposase-like protein
MSRQQEMFGLMRQWELSGLSKAEFARRAGISANEMSYWFRLYRERSPETVTTGFVQIVPETPAVSQPTAGGERVRLELPDGLVVIIY